MKDDALFVHHMLDAIDDIEEMMLEGEANFYNKIAIKHGICRCFMIVGEASNRVSKNYQHENSHIDWKNIIGLRNIIVHQYDNVEYETVWEICIEKIPVLKKQLVTLIDVEARINNKKRDF